MAFAETSVKNGIILVKYSCICWGRISVFFCVFSHYGSISKDKPLISETRKDSFFFDEYARLQPLQANFGHFKKTTFFAAFIT